MIFHVTPITPNAQLQRLGRRAFMVRWQRPDQLQMVLQQAEAVRFENGAYGIFRAGKQADWNDYYRWLEPNLFDDGRDAIIPDVIGAGEQLQDALVHEWPFGDRGLPVWHTDESIGRLNRLLDHHPRVAIGATGEHWQIWKPGRPGSELAEPFRRRMDDDVIPALLKRRTPPRTHFLRGAALLPLYPVLEDADASSVGQNGHRHRKKALPLFPHLCGGVDYADKMERASR